MTAPVPDAVLQPLRRLDDYLANNKRCYLRVACPSQEFPVAEMARGTGRWLSCSRGLWESLSLADEPGLVLVMLQAPPVDQQVMQFLFDVVQAGRRRVVAVADRHVLINLDDSRPSHLSEKVLERRELIERLRAVVASARRRGQSVQGLSCFASSERMASLARLLDLDLLETPPDTLRFGTKAGSRRIFRAAGVAHPVGSYAPERSLAGLAAEAASLTARHGPGRWLVKLDEGFGSGHGNALLSIGEDSRASALFALEYELLPACPDMTRAEFLSHIADVGAIVERYVAPPPGGATRFPSVACHIARSPDGDAELAILGSHEQVIGPGQDFIGCSFPALSSYRRDLLLSARRVADVLTASGVRGHVGLDFIATATTQSAGTWDVVATEINLRQTGSMHPNRVVRAVVDGRWLPDGSLVDDSGTEIVYTATDSLVSERYRGIPAPRLAEAVRDETAIRYDAGRIRGVIPHLWTALEPFGKIGATVIGRSASDCAALEGGFVALLERLAREQGAPQ